MPQNIIDFPTFWLQAYYYSVPLCCYYTNIFMSINYEYAFLFRSNATLCLLEISLPKITVQFHYAASLIIRIDTTSKITTTDFDLHQKTLKSWLYSTKTVCMYRRHPSEASLKWVLACIYCMHGACHIFKQRWPAHRSYLGLSLLLFITCSNTWNSFGSLILCNIMNYIFQCKLVSACKERKQMYSSIFDRIKQQKLEFF